jgi:peptide-methionine (S)-S-oxide reductase
VPFKAFFRAEDYHQDYLQNHTDQPYIVYNDLPKLEHLKKQFPELYRNQAAVESKRSSSDTP